MMTKERMNRIKECKALVHKLPLETAIQLEETEYKLEKALKEVKQLREALTLIATDGALSSIEIMRLAEKALEGAGE